MALREGLAELKELQFGVALAHALSGHVKMSALECSLEQVRLEVISIYVLMK